MDPIDNLLALMPVEKYDALALPTLEEHQPELLKKVPARWKKKAIAASVMGLLGTASLASCGSDYQEASNRIVPNWPILENGSHCWMHHGGSGGAPIYIAYLTEQEAIEIIRAELETAGLVLAENTPRYGVEVEDEVGWGQSHQIEVNLFNEQHQLAISLVEPSAFHAPFARFDMDGISELIEDEFAQNHPHLSLALFCSPDSWLGWAGNDSSRVTNREKAAARERLRENLVDQAQSFIQHLREKGILE